MLTFLALILLLSLIILIFFELFKTSEISHLLKDIFNYILGALCDYRQQIYCGEKIFNVTIVNYMILH